MLRANANGDAEPQRAPATPNDRRSVTAGTAFRLIAAAAAIGGLTGGVLGFGWGAWMMSHASTGDVLAGTAPFAGMTILAFVGTFFGAAVGWVRLVVATGRERRDAPRH